MNSFMNEDDQKTNTASGTAHIYTNICLTVISIALVVISICFIVSISSGPTFDGKSVLKFAICDPKTERCVKVNAGRRLETTN